MDEDYEIVSNSPSGAASPKSLPRRRRPALSCTICRRPQGAQAPGSANAPAATVQTSSSHGSPSRGGLYVFDSRHQTASGRVAKSRPRVDELHELRHRVQVLEGALSRTASVHTPDSSGYDVMSTSGLAGPSDNRFISNHVKDLSEKACFRGKNGKTRFCGRSYYGTSVAFFNDISSFLMGRHRMKRKGSEYMKLKKFKGELWSREKRDHQVAYREKAFTLQEMIPHRRVADELLHLYLSTFETTYRILHVPMFLKQYEAYWEAPETPDMVFVAKLLAMMAASSCFFSPTTRLNEKDTLHTAAVGWILAVQSWIASSFVSSAIDFNILQIQCILMIARQADATDGDLVWISSGSVIRTAMTLGLHRNPSRFPKVSKFWAEMRRRLWATILELDLQSSLDRGMPSSIDLDEFDCDPPAGYDDADLTEDMMEYPPATNTGVSTGNGFQLLLSASLPLRVRIAKQVNSLKFSLSYDEALRSSEQLFRYLNDALSLLPTPSPTKPPVAENIEFTRSFLTFLLRRFILTLHRPFALSVIHSPKFSYSRKICLEASLEMLSQLDPPAVSLPEAQPCPHLGQLSGGMFRDEVFHAAITICVELSLQANEFSPLKYSGGDSSGSLNSLNDLVRSQREVLLRAVERTIDSFASRLSPKGKGFKAFLFLVLILASVKARLDGEDPFEKVEAAGTKAIQECEQLMRGGSRLETRGGDDAATQPMLTPAINATAPDLTFDPTSLPSVDIASISPLDFGNLMDGPDYGLPDFWDADFLAGL
ncbi:hypothetical protein FE257_007231 [Aspergillus nanangensis]|uniref:Xylanolytic transcriptional activator regulatory domain-containing protein n=1 Tax=Aspergillus nanangensis TaxID=2582783 RepID=A0AAD4CN34_ASPNN|nr:hypothetical protein FE257_007231 [Aspergillus nanangensis]